MANTYSNPYAYMPQKSSGAYWGQGGSSYVNPYNRGAYGQAQQQQTSVDPYTQMQRNKKFGVYGEGQPKKNSGGGWSPGGGGMSFGLGAGGSSIPAQQQRQYGEARGAQGYFRGGGVQSPAYAGQQGQADNQSPVPGSQAFTGNSFDANAVQRLAYLKSQGAGIDNAERNYLERLQKSNPLYSEYTGIYGAGDTGYGGAKPWAGMRPVINPMTGRSESMTYDQYKAVDPNANASQVGNMQSMVGMLPQLKQMIMSVPSGPGEPSPEERWNDMLRMIMSGSTMPRALSSNAWGGI